MQMPPLDETHDHFPLGRILSTEDILRVQPFLLHVSPETVSKGHQWLSANGHYNISGMRPDAYKVETIFERVRAVFSPAAPQRYKNLHTWTCIICACFFKSPEFNRQNAHIYAVVPSPNARIIVLDMQWRDVAGRIMRQEGIDPDHMRKNGANIPIYSSPEEGVEKSAEMYWQGLPVSQDRSKQRLEAIIEGDVQVITKLNVANPYTAP